MHCLQCKYTLVLSLSLSAFFCLLLHVSLYVTLVCSLLPCSLVAGLKGKCFPVAGTDQINRSGLSDTSNVLFAIPLQKLTLPLLPQISLFFIFFRSEIQKIRLHVKFSFWMFCSDQQLRICLLSTWLHWVNGFSIQSRISH